MLRMPSRAAVRAIRQAISPRLAMRTERSITASERVTGARSTYCGVWPALACGGGEECGGSEGCGAGIGAAPGAQTGSTGGTKVAADGVVAGGGELPALRDDRRCAAAARASPLAFAGAAFDSGFMMLTAGIDAALGKSASMTDFFWA